MADNPSDDSSPHDTKLGVESDYSTEGEPPTDPPTISCSQCNRTWTLEYELEELHAGNSALEQFAMDHQRHTGHFPDDVMPFIADCTQCPTTEQYLSHRPAERFAETHARHTGHTVTLDGTEESDTISGTDVR